MVKVVHFIPPKEIVSSVSGELPSFFEFDTIDLAPTLGEEMTPAGKETSSAGKEYETLYQAMIRIAIHYH